MDYIPLFFVIFTTEDKRKWKLLLVGQKNFSLIYNMGARDDCFWI